MLIITKSAGQSMLRHKYHPRKLWPMFYVHDTEVNRAVFGPNTRDACQRYIDSNAGN